MRILVILSRFPYPLEKGDKLRAFHQLNELHKRHEIILVTLTDKKIKNEWRKEVEKICHQLHVFKLKKPLIYWNTIKQTFTGKPFQIGYFYQNHIQRKIDKIILHKNPAHIYCQLLRTTEYVKNNHSIPKTLDYMDALGKGMYRRAEITNGLKRKLFLEEGKRLTAYENRIFDYFDHHTIISEQDRNYINHPKKTEITIIENGISEHFHNYKKKKTKEFDLVFIGNMNYPPNIECAEYLVNQIFSEIQKSNPDTKLLLAGANPSLRVTALAKHPNVTVSGWVEDIRDSYASGCVFVAPLFIGTGLQNKLLEAMAMGLPCVTTSLANNALGAIDMETVLIANNQAEFIAKTTELLKNESRYSSIAEKAKDFVLKKYNWKASIEKLVNLLEN